jgi:hypothetical protein
VVEYDAELQTRAAAEVEAMADGSAVAGLLGDYAVMRDQARACAKVNFGSYRNTLDGR